MAVLIPALSSCAGRMTAGERRLAERLQQKLEADYLLWWDVPVGPKQTRPDFVVLHPARGALILETKDWRLDTIQRASRDVFEIVANGQLKRVANPLQQARHCAIQVVNALERDPQLVHGEGPHCGKLAFPWGHGVVLTRITRRQFEAAGLGEAIPSHLVVCQDEMLEDVDPEAFQKRLWDMFPHAFRSGITLPQLDRIRWHLFPEVRVPEQQSLFGDSPSGDEAADERMPDLLRVMDLQQEQLARSLGEGHRVIHGVAGSGKTMILGFRAEQLAQTQGPGTKPILVLCFNEPLAVKLAAGLQAKGLGDRVQCMHFHKWTREQLKTYHLLPSKAAGWSTAQLMDAYVQRLIKGVDDNLIPGGQYHAILIDEGHDFRPEWLKVVTQMVDPKTQSLLLLYDDAQSIYDRDQKRGFSLKSVGIQAQGRTTILRVNYRNTRQILELAHQMAGKVLKPDAGQAEDEIPLLQPLSCGREGAPPIVIDLPTLPLRAARVAELLADQHAQGHAWGDMAVICRTWSTMERCAEALKRKQLPFSVRKRAGQFDPAADTIKVITMHASKGLEWPVVALVDENKGALSEEEAELEARLVYVGATRATHSLIISTVPRTPAG